MLRSDYCFTIRVDLGDDLMRRVKENVRWNIFNIF